MPLARRGTELWRVSRNRKALTGCSENIYRRAQNRRNPPRDSSGGFSAPSLVDNPLQPVHGEPQAEHRRVEVAELLEVERPRFRHVGEQLERVAGVLGGTLRSAP